MIAPDQLKGLIQQTLPDAQITVQDLTGTQDHYQATVVAGEFATLNRVKQHQLVYQSVQTVMSSGELHALSLKTYTPEQWQTEQANG
ncbi:MAG: BolA/IbaG family iron-sulfur metabolism protein [Cyanobacteria bacterium J06632_22]